jgi:hypothetical protein
MRTSRPPAGAPGWLYAAIVITLCIALLGGGFGWFLLALYGLQMPDGLAAILATIAGGLVGVLMPGGSRPIGRDGEPRRAVGDVER